MPDPVRQRAFALEIAKKLRAAGFQALWAGGCVRDELLGLVPKDYDVATDATPAQIRDLFGRRSTLPIGAAFGVVAVLGPRAAGQIDVATFRSDNSYTDGRRPDSVTFTTAEEDAQRRDFTINGLFLDPIAQVIVDYVGGQDDLKRGVVRAIGQPRHRFNEDKLRLLRAVRFAASYRFSIDPPTLAAINELAPKVTEVSPERIGMEIRRMLVDKNRAEAIRLLQETGLLDQVLPELAPGLATHAAGSAEVLERLARLEKATLALAFAALVLLSRDADVAAMGRRLRFTNKEIERAQWLIANLPIIATAPSQPWPKLQRILTHEGVDELLALHASASDHLLPAVEFCRERLAWPIEKLNPPPLISGTDLLRHGLKPGPDFATLLERVRDAQLDGRLGSAAEALAYVDCLLADGERLP